ncbi:hypothetical protein [Streptomyces uncialis]|uniref:Uncharacterized protein n=1 Tax=Streptomyces uncialis TaxID=1048205 RepID=A0A1Q4V0B0_9ACTN|nr:hypothetical protein [Streptomyces uncialis]OKH91236.1 hypothetical protein AB852_32970 [Streptomyces uncialis]WTE11151.1 hypothetical protein OG924_13250 [Streptomyces uncialis]
MHPEVHLLLHEQRAAALRREAAMSGAVATRDPERAPLRNRLGWTLVELGLRLATTPAVRGRRPAPGM